MKVSIMQALQLIYLCIGGESVLMKKHFLLKFRSHILDETVDFVILLVK